MKKHIILLGLLATTSVAFAQAGKVGVNTSNPEATLDIRPSAANAANTANTNEGILIPRVSRDRLKSIATVNLKESTLVYVDNISGTTNAVTSNVTSKGFYYYSTTASKWVKIAEGTIQEQDLRLVGGSNHITQDAGLGGNGTTVGGGGDNIGIGPGALFSLNGGGSNLAIGARALYSNAGSGSNLAIGNEALADYTGGGGFAIGHYAFRNGGGTGVAVGHYAFSSGGSGVAVGNSALSSGGSGIAIGNYALSSSTNGISNLAIGNNALYNTTTGKFNIGIGERVLYKNTTGNDNIAVGNDALSENTTGNDNIALGNSALLSNTTGASNFGFGTNALRSNTTGNNNIAMGPSALFNNTTGLDNVAVGAGVLFNNTVGANNIGLGTNALRTNTTGRDNIALGSTALFANTTGVNNIAIGSNGLRFNTTGNNNIGFGTNTLRLNTTGHRNIAIGEGSLSSNTSGGYNVGLGISALAQNTTGVSNIGIGNSALIANTTGTYNIGLGYYPLSNTTTGSHNIALGYSAMEANVGGNYNLAFGPYALRRNTTGQHNNAYGLNSLQNNVTGSGNIAVGNGSGEWIKGDSNIHLGSASFPTNNTAELDNVIVIGNGINDSELTPSSGQDNTIILGYKKGHNRSPNVGVGTYKPDAKLHIEANGPTAIKIVDTNQGAGKVLTSDANGVGTWKVPAIAMAQGHLGNPGRSIRSNTANYLYTGSYIDVPANTKYLVTVSALMAMYGKRSTCHFWLRTMFTTSPTSQTPHGANGKTLISGLLPQGAPFAILQGSVILDNSGNPNIRTYYYMAGSVSTHGCAASDELYNFGGTTWGEGAIYGMPIQ